jgi:predicted transglutaminase-like cysteine proteinase
LVRAFCAAVAALSAAPAPGISPGAHASPVLTVPAPLGFKVFCLTHPSECVSRPATSDIQTRGGVVLATPRRMTEIETVNRAVNAEIRPLAEGPHHDQWQVGPAAGDCEDFALTKQHTLIGLGWPTSALLLSEVRTARGDLHTVLVVRTDAGDLVLDNLFASVQPVAALPYRWLSVQSSNDPKRWRTARPSDA